MTTKTDSRFLSAAIREAADDGGLDALDPQLLTAITVSEVVSLRVRQS